MTSEIVIVLKKKLFRKKVKLISIRKLKNAAMLVPSLDLFKI